MCQSQGLGLAGRRICVGYGKRGSVCDSGSSSDGSLPSCKTADAQNESTDDFDNDGPVQSSRPVNVVD